MKNNVEKRMPQNIDDLIRFLVEEWEAISQKTVNNLVSSMKTRCELVLVIGSHIKFLYLIK